MRLASRGGHVCPHVSKLRSPCASCSDSITAIILALLVIASVVVYSPGRLFSDSTVFECI
jgi:hypothetical protein